MARQMNVHQDGIYGHLPAQQVSNVIAQQQLLLQHREVEYFYVYVAESECFNAGYWIALEPDKTLSLESLRSYYSTCFGIKYKIVNAKNQMETKYVRYHNGYFRFPPGLDMNNMRFVAYYYNDTDDVNAFMEMTETNVNGSATVAALARNDSSFLCRTMSNFEMESILQRGAQSTPKAKATLERIAHSSENVSSTSDVIVKEKTIEIVSVHDSQSILQKPSTAPKTVLETVDSSKTIVTGIKSKLGPSVSSTSDMDNMECVRKIPRIKYEQVSIDDSNESEQKHRSVMVKVKAASQSKNMLNRYQQTRFQSQGGMVNKRTPLKITLRKSGRHTERDAKILKIEDEKGRTTALLTKRKWAGKTIAIGTQKRRIDSVEDPTTQRFVKRRKYEIPQYGEFCNQPAEQRVSTIYKQCGGPPQVLNILLVGFKTNAPIIHKTTSYFSDFGIVLNLQLYIVTNRYDISEYYALMKIRTSDAVSLFADRHLYNGTTIYAIRMDDQRLPTRVKCKICAYEGINIAYLNYHMEGHCHQFRLQKQLESFAGCMADVYHDSYYRITDEQLYVEFPNSVVDEIIRKDYMKQMRNKGILGVSLYPPSNQQTERGRYF
ncbi:uncharacterized protein LOC131430381 [Malaya genurostris]|uniref:uncharacterized protein LOC131430381 n=1 Tax=Malaya genurostris TaxID=325434 RepID=UPI0026F404EC|nr:uncharacterized protein LOC131430381 [Malaya genurostris]